MIGFVLEGGAMRGMFTAGVMDVLMENDIPMDAAIGVSAGACFGCNLKSKQIGRVLRYNLRFAKEKKYCSVSSWIKTGDLYGAEFCYHTLPKELDVMDKETYESNPMKFEVCATDVETGKPVYHDCALLNEESLEWIRASASMPIAARPVEINGKKYLDGGISDSVPVQYYLNEGYEKIVLILTQPKGYRKKPMKGMKLIGKALKDYPKVVEALQNRHIMYNETMDQIDALEKEGRIFVIRPDEKLNIGKTEHNTVKIRSIYKKGRFVMFKHMDELKAYLEV